MTSADPDRGEVVVYQEGRGKVGYTLNERRLRETGLGEMEQALGLLVAESEPQQKDLMIRLTVNLIEDGL